MLSHGGQYVNGELGRGRHVAGDEVGAVLHQGGDESYVAGKAVEAGDKQHGAALAALGEGGEELGPVGVPAPALDLGELGHEPAGG